MSIPSEHFLTALGQAQGAAKCLRLFAEDTSLVSPKGAESCRQAADFIDSNLEDIPSFTIACACREEGVDHAGIPCHYDSTLPQHKDCEAERGE